MSSTVTWPSPDSVREAERRIRPWIEETPLRWELGLERALGRPVALKCENEQAVGAFKSRGACNAVFALDDAVASRGVATHSSGNHAAALARAAHLRGIQAHVVMPEGAARPKREAAAAWGAEIVTCPPTMAGRIQALARLVEATGAHVVHPYEDHHVMSGQGTVALELEAALEPGDTLLVPLGGGGLISGMACYLAERQPAVNIVGVEPAGADDALRSWQAGKVIAVEPNTVADGLRATIGQTNLDIVRRHVSKIITVPEEAIREAMGLIWHHSGMRVEPSAAVSVAALLDNAALAPNRALCVLTGGNVEVNRFDVWS
ncbi:threonine dehydratase [Natronospira proteinivora]|uniref:Threonine dehydratase n=1 Tax=Natronospira proteinivora TaxID=1807133 RepID=A0ABT1G5E2_9GAMM|nr:pyridoxal-phosphate dependent enzyme [Natronospira proteinivora]MCP1726496.1 threonine dehydratase [Natronospira proteinivora]